MAGELFKQQLHVVYSRLFLGAWLSGDTDLRSCPVDPAFGTWVHVDQNQPLNQGRVV